MLQSPSAAAFHLEEVLGVGTVGSVYRARMSSTGETVAVKLLSRIVSGDSRIKARFEREMIILEKLNHPNIVRYYGGGSMNGQVFYAMELIDGGSIKDRMTQVGRFTWQQVVEWAIQICSALQHAHNHGIIHRDLKPSNLFFMQDGRLVLGDFGVARDTGASDLTGDGITVGTYAYMPPEQICADQQISNRTDLYALGCVLFELLAGRPPFLGENFAQIWDQHLRATPPNLSELVPDCPDWLIEIVEQLLQKDPERRPFNARHVEGFLKQHREEMREAGHSVEIPGGSLSLLQADLPVTSETADGVSWLSLAGAVLAAVAITGVAWYFQAR